MNDRTEHTFSLRVGPWPEGALVVHAFHGRERLNGLYELTVDVSTELEDALEESVPGQPARFEILSGNGRRTFHGIIVAARADGHRRAAGARRSQYRMRLVPRAWLLGLRRTSRIFQHMRVDRVVRAVLGSHHIPSRWSLQGKHPVREYCTQFEETDLEFVLRLTAESGIAFYFEQHAPDPAAGLGAGVDALFQQARGLVDDAAGAALGAIGGAAQTVVEGVLAGLDAEVPSEVMVFTDDASRYAPLTLGVSPFLSSLDRGVSSLPVPPGVPVSGMPAAIPGSSEQTLPRRAVVAGAAVLHMRPESDALHLPGADTVLAFARGREVSARAAEYREYDPRRPRVPLGAREEVGPEDLIEGAARGALDAVADLARRGLASPARPDAAFEAVGEPARSGVGALGQSAREAMDAIREPDRPLEIYEHHGGHSFPDWDHALGEPGRILRSARRNRDVAAGESVCPWLAAGHVFQLEDHDVSRLNRAWVPVAVEHEGRAASSADGSTRTYSNRFECVPAEVTYVPERPRRRSVQVCLTATVVGSGATGVETDPGGHVRVRFHWDRERRAAGYDSCWIRVMQPWAGVGWGFQFIPRVGMEVVVTFEGGDPDKPLVLGCVYNGTSPPPFPLPQHGTRSGLRTQSTPGSGGANELWFEDAAGRERVHVRAERDLELSVQNDRIAHVQRDDLVTVVRERHLRVGGELRVDAAAGREVRVARDDRLHVDGNRTSRTTGSASDHVTGDRRLRVEGSCVTEIEGPAELAAKSNVVERIRGSFVRLVGAADAKRSHVTHVEGDLRASSSELVELAAEREIVLRCGDSSIRLGPQRIVVSSPELVLEGDGARIRLMQSELRAQAESKIQAVADDVVLKASGAALGLSSEAAVEGARILLNSPQQATDSVEPSSALPTVVELVDDEGRPIPDQPYRIVLDSGSELCGTLDEEGRAVLDLEGGGEIHFPGLRDVATG